MNDQESKTDPLIDEIRSIRREISEQFDDDVDKLCDHLQELDREHHEHLATPEQLRLRRNAG